MNSLYRLLLRIRPAFVASFLKRVLRIRRRVVETPEGRFFVDPASNFGFALLSKNEYEPELTHTVKSLLQAGDVFFDLGANEGYFSVVAAQRVGATGTVLCVEPQSRLQPVIFRNLSENHAPHVRVFQVAVSDTDGFAELSLPPDINTGHGALFRKTRYRNPTEIVPQITLTGFLDRLAFDEIDLMKIDIEGFEYEAILGSKEIFERGKVKHIALELHPSLLKRRGKNGQEILDFLRDCRYERNMNYSNLVLSRKA